MISNKTQSKVSSAWRIVAAVLIVCWVAAVSVCSAEPILQHSACGSEETHSHGDATESHASHEASSHDHDDDSPTGKCHDNPFCDSLTKTALSSAPVLAAKPDMATVLAPDLASLFSSLTSFGPSVAVDRQRPGSKFVFTPEVCLGAAVYSLAPPVLL